MISTFVKDFWHYYETEIESPRIIEARQSMVNYISQLKFHYCLTDEQLSAILFTLFDLDELCEREKENPKNTETNDK